MDLLLRFKQILLAFGFVIAILFTAFKFGQNNQKNKDNEDIINKIKKDEEFKQSLDSVSVADKRKWLRERFSNKKN